MTQKKNTSGKGKKPAGKKVEEKAPVTPVEPTAETPETTIPEPPEMTIPEPPETTATEAPETDTTKASNKKKVDLSNKDRAKKIFDSHPNIEVLYFASDGTAFFEPQYARIHGESLKVKEFITIKRKDL